MIQLQIEHAVIAGVQDPEPIGFGLHGHVWVGGTVDHRRVHVTFGHDGYRRRYRMHQISRSRSRQLWGPEPWTIVPPAKRIRSIGGIRVLVGHVNMGEPKIANPAPMGEIPEWIGRCCGAGHECPVLDDQRNAKGVESATLIRKDSTVDQRQFVRIIQQITRSFAGINIETGHAIRMVMVEHQPTTLLVGIIVSRRPGTRIRHVGNVLLTHTIGIGSHFSCGGNPLVGRSIADPWSKASMKMKDGTILCVVHGHGGHSQGAHPRSHDGGVHRQEEIAVDARGEHVAKLDSHRYVALGDDQRSHIMVCPISRRGEISIAPQFGCGQIRVHLLGVVEQPDLVIIGSRIRIHIRIGNRNILSEVVVAGRPQPRQ